MDRHAFTALDTVIHVWTSLELPEHALKSLHLPVDAECCPSSFKVGHLAQASIGLSALSAALFWSLRYHQQVPEVTVPARHAYIEFKTERLYVLNGKPAPSDFGTIGGLHKTRDGYIRMHDGFPVHREIGRNILGLHAGATRDDVSRKMLEWNTLDLESKAIEKGAVMAALRSFKEWDALPQSKAISDFPILLKKISERVSCAKNFRPGQGNKCMRGIRVIELSRVIAAPVAGKTLAAHGAVSRYTTFQSLRFS